MENEIVLFESEDDQVKLNVEFDGETVWLTKEQMAALFGSRQVGDFPPYL